MKQKYLITSYLLYLSFFISPLAFSKKTVVLPDLMKPSSIHISGNTMYILDDFTVRLYMFPGFKQIKTVLKKGSGPAEVQFFPELRVTHNSFSISSIGKLLIFSHSGELRKETRVPQNIESLYPLGDHFVGSNYVTDLKGGNQFQSISLYDKNVKVIREIFKGSIGSVTYFNSDAKQKQKFEVIKDCTDFFVYKDRLYIADTAKGLFFSVYDSQGNKLYEINTPYEKHKVTDAFKERSLQELKQSPFMEKQYYFVFKDYFPAFKYVKFADDKIYLVTHPFQKDKCALIVMDLKGKILKKTTVPDTYLFTIDKNKFYYLVDNDDEQVWELNCIDL